jgi:hypothetical protein
MRLSVAANRHSLGKVSNHHNHHTASQMLLDNLLPSLLVHVAIDDGLRDGSHMQLGKLPFYR